MKFAKDTSLAYLLTFRYVKKTGLLFYYLFIYLFTYLLTYLFTHSLIYSFIYLFIHSLFKVVPNFKIKAN